MTTEKVLESMRLMLAKIEYCITISWCASPFHSMYRVFSKLALPLTSIFLSLFSKDLINTLSYGEQQNGVLVLSLMIFIVSVLNLMINKVAQYSQEIHSNLIEKEIRHSIMRRLMNIKREHYDSTEYMNTYSFANTNSLSIINLLWNIVDFFASLFSFFVVFISMLNINTMYGILLAVASLPASFGSRYFTKRRFLLAKDQIKNERKKSYFSEMLSSKRYAGDVRMFKMGDHIISQFLDLWKKNYDSRERLLVQRTIVSIALEALPLLMYAYILYDMALGVRVGHFLPGDITFWISVSAQLQAYISLLVHSTLGVYENKLHAEQLRQHRTKEMW